MYALAGPDPDKPKPTNDPNISIIKDEAFPFLDVELYWRESCSRESNSSYPDIGEGHQSLYDRANCRKGNSIKERSLLIQ
mmetsp:Transcript_2140/g.4149  ORF Transcript_2140/g.4149 Transcript_2140/m.4149 type:complete len:80 (+) Transcript_2140:171-410(+)